MKRLARGEARKRWAALASGEALDAETLAWIADVARDVLAADDLKGGDRRPAMLAAVQLSGQSDATAEAIRQCAAVVDGDPAISGTGPAAVAERRLRLRTIVRALRLPGGAFDADTSDDTVDSQIRRARNFG